MGVKLGAVFVQGVKGCDTLFDKKESNFGCVCLSGVKNETCKLLGCANDL